ncbi:MAG: TonB-dependent receptor [Burkholderiaceae bacterium]
MKKSHAPRELFRVQPVAAGCMVLALIAAGAAHAQEAAPAPAAAASDAKAAEEAKKAEKTLETVTVTGIRRGLEAAISVKKNSDSIVEAISAEDIGKLPDVSVAESIARLPGVAAQRTAGRASQISIRGMAPDFSTTLLNGREQVTTGDSRSVEFDQYPAELVGGVVIYKTPDGALVGQGLSGTIDLQTVRPLNFSKRTFAANYRKQKTGIGNDTEEGSGNRISVSYIDQFADRTIGIAVGFARFDEDGAQSQRFDSWGGGVTDTPYNGSTVKVPAGFGRFVDQTKQTRDGAMAVLQFKPNQNFESVLDLYYSKFDIAKSTVGLQGSLVGNAGGYDRDGALTNATISNGVATSGTATNFKGVVRNDVEATVDKLASIGWNNKLKMGAGWTGELDLGHSKAKRTGQIFETTAGTPGNSTALETISWTGFNGSNFNDVAYNTSLNYSDPSVAKLTDVMGWGGGVDKPQAGYSKLPNVEDTLNSVRLTGRHELNQWIFSNAQIGVNLSDRKKTRAYVEGRLVIAGSTDPYAAVNAPGAGVVDIGGIPVMSWDPRGSIGSVYEIAPKREVSIANKDWTVKEKVTTAFAKLDIDSETFGLPLRGNVGLQIAHTDQRSNAFNVDNAPCTNDFCAVTDVSAGTTFTDVLPSANLVWDLGRDQTLRLGMAKVLARPTINDMRASYGLSIDTANLDSGQFIKPGSVLKVDAGNPYLKPFKADALDLSYEKYFGTKAYVGVAGFYKKLDTYILTTKTETNLANVINGDTVLPSGPNGTSTYGWVSQKINGTGGNIKGFELTANMPFNLVSSWLDGFGAYASYADTKSSVRLPASGFAVDGLTTTDIPLPGLSRKVHQVAFYFEKWGFSVRWAQRYRSDFVGEVSDQYGDRKLTYVKGERIADLQVGYEFQEGPLKGLSLLAQVLNLNNTPYIRYKDTPENEVERVKYGKTYLFGANYKF